MRIERIRTGEAFPRQFLSLRPVFTPSELLRINSPLRELRVFVVKNF